MKKVLLASTALVLTAGYASAEVTVSGEANAGVIYQEDAVEETQLQFELDFNISGSGTSDSGLGWGASFDLDLDDGTTSDDIDDPEVFITGSFGTVTVGGVDSASDNVGLGISDVGFDGVGVDDQSDFFIGAGSANILYEYAIGDFQFAASASAATGSGDSSDDFGIAASYSFGDFEIQAAYEEVNGATVDAGSFPGQVADIDLGEIDVFYLGFEGSAGSFSYDLFYHNADSDLIGDDVAGYGVSVDFSTGDITWTVAVGDTDVDSDDTDFGVGLELDLGGGLAFGAGIASVDDGVNADAGFTMSF